MHLEWNTYKFISTSFLILLRVELVIDEKNKKSDIWRSIFQRLLFIIETTAILRRLESIEIAQALLLSDSESEIHSGRKTVGANSLRYSGKLSIILAGPPDDKDDWDDISSGSISVRESFSEVFSPGSRRSSVTPSKRNSIKTPLSISERNSFERSSLSPELPPLNKSRSEAGNLDKLPTINKSPNISIRNKSVTGPPSPVTSIRNKSDTRNSPVALNQDRSRSVSGPPSPVVTKSSVADGNTHTISQLKRPSGAHLQPMKESSPVTASKFDPRGTKTPRSPVTSRNDSEKSTDQKVVRSNSFLIPLNVIPSSPVTAPSPGRAKAIKSLGTSRKESSSAEPSSKRIATVTSDPISKRISYDPNSRRNSNVNFDPSCKRNSNVNFDPSSKRNSTVNVDPVSSKRISNVSNDPTSSRKISNVNPESSSRKFSNVNSELSSKRNSNVGIDSSSKKISTVNSDPTSIKIAAIPLPVVVKKKEKAEIPRSEILLRHLKSGVSFSKLFGGSKDSSSPQSLRSSFLGASSTEKGNSDKGLDKEMVINENFSEREDEPESEVVDMDKVSQGLQKNLEFNVAEKGSPSQSPPSLLSILSRDPSAKLSADNSISKLFRSISIKNVGSLFKPSSTKDG